MQSFKFLSLLSQIPEPEAVSIEVHSIFQIPSFSIIGLPAQEIFEARERIRSAVDSSGFEFPKRRVTLNLSPANVPKSGVGLDLGMALSVLESEVNSPPTQSLLRVLAWGELGLSGSVRSSGQIFRLLYLAEKLKVDGVLLPKEDEQAAFQALHWYRKNFKARGPIGFWVRGVQTLKSAVEFLAVIRKGEIPSEPEMVFINSGAHASELVQEDVALNLSPIHLRMLKIALSGEHHCLMLGPKGCGKTHLLSWFSEFSGEIEPDALLNQVFFKEMKGESISIPDTKKPIRRVQSQIRPAALMGKVLRVGVRPGEFSLAHGGFLVADEFPEWPRDSIDQLRVPIETGEVILSQAEGQASLPARFQFLAAGNLCRCGLWKGDKVPCRCSLSARMEYFNRISGPVFDRIDLVFNMKPNTDRKLAMIDKGEVKEAIKGAKKILHQNWGSSSARIAPTQIEKFLKENPKKESELDSIKMESLRSRHKVFRVALTLAAMEGRPVPERAHFSEAALYRPDFLFSTI